LDERLHKLLAQHGIGSRRQVEEWIRAGRVLVNGRPAEVGQRVRTSDRITVDGRDVSKRLAATPTLRVIVYHKPGGEITRGREGDDRADVESRLPSLRSGRWLPVNPLGFGEEGLLVLSNDGTLASAIARNVGLQPVEYRVRVLRPREADDWPAMPLQIDVAGETVSFSAVERLEGAGTNVWFRVATERPLRRGALRALFDGVGLKVSRTLLVSWGPLALPRDLPRGRSRDVDGPQLDALLALAGRKKPPRPRGPARAARDRRTTAPRSGGR
jgi:23S rRNA pseudouridine2605 synthase